MGNFVVLLFSAFLIAGAASRRGTLDPAFEKLPFDQWISQQADAPFHFKVRVPRAELSFHERLVAPVEITMDGADLDTRRGNGSMVFLIEIRDGDGTRYQDHSSIELSKLGEDIKAASLEISQRAFFLPGDYQLAIAVFDTATGEHSATQAQFRVAAPPPGFLVDAWRDLPPVEFIDNEQSPDSWYLPHIQGRLEWGNAVNGSARLNVILNVAPAAADPGSRHAAPGSGLAALLPTLKALSETGSSSLSENVDLLDLGRRRAVFHQNDVKELDWLRLKTALGDANTASIDLHSLSERHHDAQFFVSEVRTVLRASDKPSVLVVLSTAVAFESGEDLEPISLEALPAVHVVYIRYRTPVQSIRPFGPQMGGRGRGGRMGGPMTRTQTSYNVVDQLEATLKPLHPKVFDVETPEEMTKALRGVKSTLLALDGESGH